MGSIFDDLDRFLKTDGVKIVMDASGIRAGPYEPLTIDDIDDFDCMNLEELDESSLENLLDKVEELRDELEDDEPEEESEDHKLWEARICETEYFIDRIQDRLDELENQESADTCTVTERIVWNITQNEQEENQSEIGTENGTGHQGEKP